MFQVVSRNGKNRFVSLFRIFYFTFWTLSSNFIPFLRVSDLLFEFRTFCSSFVPFVRVSRVGAGAVQKKVLPAPKNFGSRRLRLLQPCLHLSVTMTFIGCRFSTTFREGKGGYRKEGIQDWRDTGKEEFGMGGFRDLKLEGYRKRGIQENRNAGKDGYRIGGI